MKLRQDIIDRFDRFTHLGGSRRDFMRDLIALTGSVAAANAALASLQNNVAVAQTIPENDPRLAIDWITYPTPQGEIRGYLARPRGGARRPAVIVIHENRGLNAHIRDVTRRAAVGGFLALGVDMITPLGGTPDNEDRAREMQMSINNDLHAERLAAAVPFLAAHREGNSKVGATGFCWGGGMTNQLSVRAPTLNAAAPYYGIQAPIERVPEIRAALLFHYAETDPRINEGKNAYEAALRQHGKTFESHIYPGTQHAFNNDTSAARYDAAAARLAWERTMAFFTRHLTTTTG
jgi:carboxymethylenebutenolidase